MDSVDKTIAIVLTSLVIGLASTVTLCNWSNDRVTENMMKMGYEQKVVDSANGSSKVIWVKCK